MPIVNLSQKLLKKDRQEYREIKKTKMISRRRILVAIVIFLLAVVLPSIGVFLSAKAAMQSGRVLMAGVKQSDIGVMLQGVGQLRPAVANLNRSLGLMFWMGFIPFLGDYYNDARHFAKAAEYELAASEDLLKMIEPHKVELGLGGVTVAGQDRVAQVVKILDKVVPNLDKVEPNLKKAGEEVEGVNTDKYPSKLGNTDIRNRMEFAKGSIIGLHTMVSENRSLIEILPQALGGVSPKTYLLLFQNDKELRATGGFMTAYAFLTLDKGRLNTPASDDIYRLDERLLKSCLTVICPLTPPVPIVKYLPEFDGKPRKAWSLRDANLSPDFSVSMGDFENMYKFIKDGESYDGVIAIDTKVVEELIKLTGPIDVFGTTYSSQTDKRCDCPNVIYELEHYAQIAAKGEEDRKAVLGTLMQQILAKSLGIGPEKLPDFLTAAIKLANDKHVLFYMHDPKLQQGLAELNWVGKIQDSDGEYLHINDSNFAGGKSNLYVDEKVTYDLTVDSNQSLKGKFTIEYKNPRPYNTWLNGILRNYVRIYVPLGSKLTFSKGSDEPVTTNNDEKLGKTFFEIFLTVRPQNSRILELEYTSPVKVSGKTLPLLIQKQPGAKDHHYIVKVNGKKKEEFDLTADKKLQLSF